jgi:hypothetical protein
MRLLIRDHNGNTLHSADVDEVESERVAATYVQYNHAQDILVVSVTLFEGEDEDVLAELAERADRYNDERMLPHG